MNKNMLWQDLYMAAMLELDHAQLQSRIEAAQRAIGQAQHELASKPGENAGEDMQALQDALRNLQTLQRVELRKSAPAHDRGGCVAGGSL
jgi:ATP/maltotriose-dependent transcriptional regulator MalT